MKTPNPNLLLVFVIALCLPGISCTNDSNEQIIQKDIKQSTKARMNEQPKKVDGVAYGHGEKKGAPQPSYVESLDHETKPFPPSNITTNKGHEKLSELDFEDPTVCASCHPVQYAGWKGSMHANSFADPIFQKVWDQAEKATDGQLMNECGGCHTPIGTVTGNVKHDKKSSKFTAGPLAEQGVSCDVCHTITKSNALQTKNLEYGNASFKIEPTGPGGKKRGPLKDAVSPYHNTEYSELHTKSEFCANCHQIFNSLSGFPVERTYDEWKYSPYARAGIQCQDCHMNSVDVAVRVAKEMKPANELKGVNLGGVAGIGAKKTRNAVHFHYFAGGNTLVTSMLHGKDSINYKEATRRLKSAAEVKLDLKKQKDGLYNLSATVHNVASGHYLPTSLNDIREVWVEVVVRDSADKMVYSSGVMDKHGALDYENVTMFHSIALDKNGKETHLPWEVYSFASNTSIPPKGYSTSNYVFDGSKAKGELKVDVKLNYRSYSQHLADSILGENKVEVPVIVMQRESLVEKL